MDRQESASRGLSEAEARRRLTVEGPNELPRPERRSPLTIILSTVREPMFALLLASAVIYLLLGELRESLTLLAFATGSVSIAALQEIRTERVLDALRDLTSPRALVVRDGERRRIAGRDVVRGDLIVLSEGDRVPADARLLSAQDLQADESLLTGEAVPVHKRAVADGADPGPQRPGGDGLPQVFSGTLVVSGAGLAEVTATGARSEIGRIGVALGSLETEPPRLRVQTQTLVRYAGAAGLVVTLLVILLYGMLRGSWLEAALSGIVVGMSMLPEEFPLVLTVFMAMGAWRISRAGVLTRRAAAIETLGAATVLCTDKTGTLTENRMSIVRLQADAAAWRVEDGAVPDGPLQALLAHGVLASAVEPFDPMEKAFHALAAESASDGRAAQKGRTLIRQYGLRPELLAVTQVWDGGAGQDRLVAAKGAPEAIALLCGVDGSRLAAIQADVAALAQQGMRVLGVARTSIGPDTPLPDGAQGFARFEFLGLVGLADPLRASVPQAIRQCRSAGIRVVMITGDYPATAQAIARQAGLDPGQVVSGEQLASWSDRELDARVGAIAVFARIMPEQKLRIVEALKRAGEIVAMTGDGVNDAPSLKAAHIGIAMGGRGTDVAREAAALVLLEDDFGSIVAAIALGRRITDNLRKALAYIVAIHVPIAGMALLPLLLDLPLLFLPIHIAFLEMVIDPVCSIVFEAEPAERDIMDRPPQPPRAPLFSRPMLALALGQGAVVLLLVGALFVVATRQGLPPDEARTLGFVALLVGNIALVLANRSFSTSLVQAIFRTGRTLWIVLGGTTLLIAGVLQLRWTRELFAFGPLHGDDLLLLAGGGLLALLLLEGSKLAVRRGGAGRAARPGGIAV